MKKVLAILTVSFLRGLKDKGNDQQKAGKSMSGKSRNNYRRAIGTLFYFAESRG
ncbi:MAG: hypothetical protein ACYDH9_01995 [Limisphaerales bacterium]